MKTFTNQLLMAACLLMASAQAFAQTPNLIWAKTFGGTGTEFVQKIYVDAAGNTYATGYYQGTVNFDATQIGFTKTSRGSNDVFVAKYGPTGSAIWVRAFGGAAAEGGTDITLDANGNVIVIGAYASAVMIVDTPSVIGVSSVGSRDVFMVSFDNNGGFNWAKSIGGAGEDIPTAMKIDQDGNIVLTGFFYGTSDFNPAGNFSNNLTATGITFDVFLAKYSSFGNYIWAIKIGGNDVDAAYGLAIAPNNDIVITGKIRQTVDFDPTNGVFNITVSGYEDAFVAAYTITGALRYAYTFGGSSTNDVVYGNKVAFDSNKNIYIGGVFKGTVDFDPAIAVAANYGASTLDMYISKLDSSGKFKWVRNFPNVSSSANADEVMNDMVIDANNNIFITGLMLETVEFGYPASNQKTSINGFDIFLAKYTDAGNNEWAFNFGGTNDGGYSIGFDGSNDIYLGGYFSAVSPPAYFNPNNSTTFTQSINGNPDMFIAKYSETSGGCTPTASYNLNTACNQYTSPSGNYTWNASGMYQDTVVNAGGCDSVMTIELVINYGTSSDIYPTFCMGDTYIAPDGNNYTSPGTYTAWRINSVGCDSNITIYLTEVLVDASVMIAPNGLVATTTRPATFQWVDCGNNNAPIAGETSSGFSPTVTGSYGLFVTQDGCTEFSGCNTFTVPCTETFGTLSTSTCATYTSPSGATYTTAGTFNDTITNAGGCDSIITITLTVGSIDATVAQTGNLLSVAATNANYQWLDCDNGNTSIASATSRNFAPTANGNYAVIVSEGTCTDTSACFAFTAVGITDVQQRVGISVYPNPTNSLLHIELTQPEAIEVYNMLGGLMARYEASNSFSIDVAHYAQGVYLIKAGNSTKRFVKQ